MLQQLELDYTTLPELVERDMSLTQHRLERVVASTLGEDFLTIPPIMVIAALADLIGRTHILWEILGEGFTALLLLGKLPVKQIAVKPYFTHFLYYIATQSVKFKQLVYPILISEIDQLFDKTRNYVLRVLFAYEGQTQNNNSGFELLLSLLGPSEFVNYMPFTVNNPTFILNHLNTIPITLELIESVLIRQNFELADTLLEHFSDPGNQRLL